MDLKVYSEDLLANEDRRWLGVRDGTDTMRSITLDPTLFSVDHLIHGSLPSGTILGKVTSTSLYGPYDNAASDGREVADGLLFSTTHFGPVGIGGLGPVPDLSTVGRQTGALYWEGIVLTNFLPNFVASTGKLDTPGRADLKFIRFETGA